MSSDSLCVVCPPDGEGPCFEGPCSSAPSSGVVVASGTFGGEPAWALAAGTAAWAAILGVGVGQALRGRSVVRQSRPR